MSKLLIVDDEFRIRELIKKYAMYEGHEVDEAENGEQAVLKCRNNSYDLVIMDIMMPVMDGFGAVEQIRKFSDTTKRTTKNPSLSIRDCPSTLPPASSPLTASACR